MADLWAVEITCNVSSGMLKLGPGFVWSNGEGFVRSDFPFLRSTTKPSRRRRVTTTRRLLDAGSTCPRDGETAGGVARNGRRKEAVFLRCSELTHGEGLVDGASKQMWSIYGWSDGDPHLSVSDSSVVMPVVWSSLFLKLQSGITSPDVLVKVHLLAWSGCFKVQTMKHYNVNRKGWKFGRNAHMVWWELV